MSLPDLKERLKRLQRLAEELSTQLEFTRDEIKDVENKIHMHKLKEAYDKASEELKFIVKYDNETWYAFPYPKSRRKADSAGQLYYVLTDLKKHEIKSKHTYEGHVCKRGWGVYAYYVPFDQPKRAIQLYKRGR